MPNRLLDTPALLPGLACLLPVEDSVDMAPPVLGGLRSPGVVEASIPLNSPVDLRVALSSGVAVASPPNRPPGLALLNRPAPLVPLFRPPNIPAGAAVDRSETLVGGVFGVAAGDATAMGRPTGAVDGGRRLPSVGAEGGVVLRGHVPGQASRVRINVYVRFPDVGCTTMPASGKVRAGSLCSRLTRL